MRKIIHTAAPFMLTLLFVYAASSKLLDFARFRGQLYNQSFPHWIADILLYTLIPLEVVTVVLLCMPRGQKAGLLLSASLLTVFSGYIALVLLHFWTRIPCSCGGILSHMPWGAHLVFNLFFAALAITALLVYPKPPSMTSL